MPGSYITITPLTDKQADRIRKRQGIVNKISLYSTVASILTLAAESLYRNLGGSEEVSHYLFQVGGYGLLGTALVTFLNNKDTVVGRPQRSTNDLEQKAN